MDMQPALLQLQQLVQQRHPLQPHEWEAFADIWTPFEAKRKTILTRPGETERYLYFVTEGVQRVYFSKPDGKEATIIFTYAPSFSGVIDSLLLQKPSEYYLETLTQSSFLRAHFHQWQKLTTESSALAQFSNEAIVHALSGVMHRMAELQCYSAEEKFMQLMKRSPHVLRLIPHKYLANYLGIDATTFSKLLGTVRL